MSGARGPGRSSSRRPGGSRPAGRPTTPRAAASGRPTKRRRAPQFTTRAVLLMSVLLLLLASYTSSLHAWWQQRGEIQSLKAEKAMREAAIEELTDTEARWEDPAFVEAQARERFGWVMPGEVGYRVIGSDGRVQGDVPALDEPPDPAQRPWYSSLWGSTKEAGIPPEASTERPDPDDVLGDE